MRRIHFFILLVLAILCLVTWTLVYFVHESQTQTDVALPTLLLLPSLTPTGTPTQTSTPTSIPSPTLTFTPTATFTPTMSPTPTASSTLGVRVREITAIMPGVSMPPTTTPFPSGTILLPAPPQPIEPLPDSPTV